MLELPAIFSRLVRKSSGTGLKARMPVHVANIQQVFISQHQSLATNNTATIRHAQLSNSCSPLQKLVRAFYSYIRPPKRLSASRDFPNSSPVNSLDQLQLCEYLNDANNEPPTGPPPVFSEMDSRLGSLFGSGWFFEWPGGKRPLNSTWPWADVKPSLLVLWGVCWMFVVQPTLEIPRNSGQKRNSIQVRDQRSPLHRTPNDFYFTQAETQSPIVKSEPLGHQHSNSSISRRDWPLFQTSSSPLDEAYTLYSQPPQSQPMAVLAPNPRRFNQLAQQADTAPLTMRSTHNSGMRVTTAVSPAHGCLDASSYSNTNERAGAADYGEGGTGNATGALKPGRSRQKSANLVANRSHLSQANIQAPTQISQPLPDFPGGNLTFVNHPHQHHGHYYEAPRHTNKPAQYRRPSDSLTPLSSATPSYYPYTPTDAMSISFEQGQQPFSSYPPLMQHHEQPQEQDGRELQQHRYPSPPAPLSENPYNPGVDPVVAMTMEMPELPQKDESDAPSPGRSRAIPKPDRAITKGEDGRFVCTWESCTEDVKAFNRKCEWSKHMDKHDRPYKCPADGCEKLPGFTYSGGLLRHQREVHGLHGGPKKLLICPHQNCKRNTGKGFSRQENLNEHLRRVHTDGGLMDNSGDNTEEDGSEQPGVKRKRGPAGRNDEGAEMRSEVARLSAAEATLRAENDEFRRNAEQQQNTINQLMREVQSLQAIVGSGSRMGLAQAPQAHM